MAIIKNDADTYIRRSDIGRVVLQQSEKMVLNESRANEFRTAPIDERFYVDLRPKAPFR
jgi:hypothetical protein